MQFQDVLGYLEQMVGVELQPISGLSETLTILSVDFEKNRYTLDKISKTKKTTTRSFNELEKIWDVLKQKGFASVEQALGGAGSSRNQPETIFANLPFVEHFQYDKKKHLYLRDSDTHQLGTLKDLTPSDTREVKKRIDRYRDFDISQFYNIHHNQLTTLKNSLSNIFTKYPGEADVISIKNTLQELEELEVKLSEVIVNIDNTPQNSLFSTDDNDDNNSDNNSDNDDDNNTERSSTELNQKSSPSVEVSSTIQKGLQSTRISQVTPTVSLIYDRVGYKEIDLQPEFQRGDRIWPKKDKARLIESILLRLPLPVFYFAERQNDDVDADLDFDWIVIDGLQRITAMVDFMKEDYKLKDLELLPQYNGCYFKDLPRKEQRKIREYQIYGHLIQISEDSDEMVRELFHRINTYGKNLSSQEIRTALYPGSANRFIKYFAAENAFVDAIPAKINTTRMLDIEYVLRTLSYMILGYEKYNYVTTDAFLSHAMQVLNKHSYKNEKNVLHIDTIYEDIDYRLKSAFKCITKIFGDSAYKKEENGKVNKTLFESLSSIFSLMSDEQRKTISSENIALEFKSKLLGIIDLDDHTSTWESNNDVWNNRGFDYSISNSTSKRITILYRFRSIVKLINEVSNMNFQPQPLLENENKRKKNAK